MLLKPQKNLWLMGCLLLVSLSTVSAQEILTNAHAHNDYLHKQPLQDALDQGFISVEADIFWVEGELLVAHTRPEIKPENTLDKLYLRPLWERFQQNQGFIHPNYAEFILLIDFKAEGEQLYQGLLKALAPYQKMLTHYQNGQKIPGALSVIISGDRPVETILAEKNIRWVGIDGRTEDLEKSIQAYEYPLISQNWNNLFKWRGKGVFPTEEKEKLHSLVQKTHKLGAKIRFWATPDQAEVWKVLHEAGVDLINIDDLKGFRDWYLSQK